MRESDNKVKKKSSVLKGMAIGLLVLFFICNPAGCGKKGPPIPPRIIIPPPVSNLNQTIKGNRLKLTWSVPPAPDKVQAAMAGFIVYRSKQPESKPLCEKCPVLFDRITDIPIDAKGPDNLFEYIETLENGYIYIYKVMVYTRSRTPGKDSNFIEFRFPRDDSESKGLPENKK